MRGTQVSELNKVQLLFLLICIRSNPAKAAECFSNPTFGCDITPASTRDNGQACCDEGFLAFSNFGVDTCEICTTNIICHNTSTDCITPFEHSQAMTFIDCCNNDKGFYFRDSDGSCQSCESAFTCHTQFSCGGGTISARNVNQCCFSQATGMSYSFMGQCVNCFTYGFLQEKLQEVERNQNYTVELGFMKVPPGSPSGFVNGTIEIVHGTTRDVDFSISSQLFSLHPETPPQKLLIRFQLDSLTHEVNETAQLVLKPTITIAGAIGRNILNLVIINSSIHSTDINVIIIVAVIAAILIIASSVTITLIVIYIKQRQHKIQQGDSEVRTPATAYESPAGEAVHVYEEPNKWSEATDQLDGECGLTPCVAYGPHPLKRDYQLSPCAAYGAHPPKRDYQLSPCAAYGAHPPNYKLTKCIAYEATQ